MSLRFRRNDEYESQDSAEDPYSGISPGVPGHCPECDGLGYIDHADLVHRTQVQHCRECGHRWEYSFDTEGVLLEIRDLATPGARSDRVRVIDLRDGAAPVVNDRLRSDETDDRHRALWLRDAARS